MALADVVREKLRRSVELYDELIAALPDASLKERLPGLPSNPLGHQLWCVVGARESYARAVVAGEWSGFACSLTGAQAEVRSDVADALARSGEALLAAAAGTESFDDGRNGLLLDVLEHETAHHGQLIRYLYGLRLPVPDGWKARYALS